MGEGEQPVAVAKIIKGKKKLPPNKFRRQRKKSCCGKKKCSCAKKKEEPQPCEHNTKMFIQKQICICGKVDCKCFGFTAQEVPFSPKFIDFYKCEYPGDDVNQICVCGKLDCDCHGFKRNKKDPERIEQELLPPCVCGKPYCNCKKLRSKIDHVPEIEYVQTNTCDFYIAPVKNYCVCGKPDCTCYADEKIADPDPNIECIYRVPIIKPLCICGKIDCDCNLDRKGPGKIEKQIEVPRAPARCVCGKIFCECNIGRATPLKKKTSIPDEDPIEIELEKSNYVKEREQLIRTYEVPSLPEAKKNLGDLADFVYEYCEAGLRMYIPSITQMAYGDLWVSPSDLLIPHVGLKAPLTRKHMQALTHEGILDIGYRIELQFINQMEIEKEEALEYQRQELTKQFQNNIRQMIKDAEAKERATCQRELKRITLEFEQRLIDEINAMKAKLEKEYAELTAIHDDRLNAKWGQKLKIAVEETTKNITKKFLEELGRQEEILTMYFKTALGKKEMERMFDIGKQAHEHKKELEEAKHRLQCRNIANMMYVLCMERKKCCEEKETIEKYYKKEIEKLSSKIDKQKQQIEDFKKEVNRQIREVQLRETCILEILKQYQKFINYTLRAAPTQAEFLLSIEKLLIFEMTDALMNLKPPSKQNLSPCEVILPWDSFSQDMEAIIDEGMGLIADDGHRCITELPFPKKKEDMVLPAFILNKKLYVREDFRNMMSQGLKPSPSNDLWNDDVDLLMDELKRSISEEEVDDEVSINTSSGSDIPKTALKDSNKSSAIKFNFSQESNPLAEMIKFATLDEHDHVTKLEETLAREGTKTSLKYSSPQVNRIDHSKIGVVETNPLLLGTQSSIELLSKKLTDKKKKNEAAIPTIIEKEEIEVKTTSIVSSEKSVSYHFKSTENLELICKSKEEFLVKNIESNNRDIKSTETLKQISEGGGSETIEISKEKIEKQNYTEKRFSIDPRDSLILRQSSLAKTKKEFSVSPMDSIEVQKDSAINATLRKKSSKLMTARDSVAFLKKSRSLLKDQSVPVCKVCHKQNSMKDKEIITRECEKCAKNKESLEVLSGGIINKKLKTEEDVNLKQIKLSHVEIISVKEPVKSTVAFDNETVTVEDDIMNTEQLQKLYKHPKKFKAKKPKQYQDPCKKRKIERRIQIVGEQDGVEHLQNEEEFTIDRMKSFISIISDHPNLIKLFTACQR